MNNQSEKGINKTLDIYTLTVFKDNPINMEFLCKKSERLCTAIFLLTESFVDNDVLKNELRKTSTKLMVDSMSLISYKKDNVFVLNNLASYSLQVLALSRIASNLKLLSLSNFEILESELSKFVMSVELELTKNSNLINQNLFEFGITSNDKIEIEGNGITSEVPASFDVDHNTNSDIDMTDYLSEGVEVDIEEDLIVNEKKNNGTLKKTTNEEADKSIKSSFVNMLSQKSDRQKAILDIIKKTGETSIKDITNGIGGCSEKTIQRELNSLIYEGVLRKVGERRWSKYMVV